MWRKWWLSVVFRLHNIYGQIFKMKLLAHVETNTHLAGL